MIREDSRARMAAEESRERLCWFCKHFDYDPYSTNSSERIWCYENHWRFSFFGSSKAQLAACIQYARQCPDFTLKQEIVDEVASLKLGPRTKQFK